MQEAGAAITTSQSAFTPTADLPGGVYTWTVRAHDAAGNARPYISPPLNFVIVAEKKPENTLYLPLIFKN